jgi:hypothetical protein
MKGWLSNFFAKGLTEAAKKTDKLQKSTTACQHHDIKQAPNVKDVENCVTCNLKICYMCGTQHFTNGCDVKCNFFY